MTVSEPTVFIVDDDDAVRRFLSGLIESIELRVEAFASARDFLEAYEPGRPGCLVLDVRMPGMSGLELQRELAEQAIDLPVIILTGHGNVQLAVHAMQAGAIDFVEKPFDNELLLWWPGKPTRAPHATSTSAKRRSRSTEPT
jgi:FixJ family two-component response regulator